MASLAKYPNVLTSIISMGSEFSSLFLSLLAMVFFDGSTIMIMKNSLFSQSSKHLFSVKTVSAVMGN